MQFFKAPSIGTVVPMTSNEVDARYNNRQKPSHEMRKVFGDDIIKELEGIFYSPEIFEIEKLILTDAFPIEAINELVLNTPECVQARFNVRHAADKIIEMFVQTGRMQKILEDTFKIDGRNVEPVLSDKRGLYGMYRLLFNFCLSFAIQSNHSSFVYLFIDEFRKYLEMRILQYFIWTIEIVREQGGKLKSSDSRPALLTILSQIDKTLRERLGEPYFLPYNFCLSINKTLDQINDHCDRLLFSVNVEELQLSNNDLFNQVKELSLYRVYDDTLYKGNRCAISFSGQYVQSNPLFSLSTIAHIALCLDDLPIDKVYPSMDVKGKCVWIKYASEASIIPLTLDRADGELYTKFGIGLKEFIPQKQYRHLRRRVLLLIYNNYINNSRDYEPYKDEHVMQEVREKVHDVVSGETYIDTSDVVDDDLVAVEDTEEVKENYSYTPYIPCPTTEPVKDEGNVDEDISDKFVGAKVGALPVTEFIRRIERLGAKRLRQVGSHRLYELSGKTILVAIHAKKELSAGIIRRELKNLGISQEAFLRV